MTKECALIRKASSQRERGTGCDNACATKAFIGNFRPMKLSRNWLCFLCVVVLSSVPSVWSQDATDSEAVRPSGVSGSVRKAKAVSAKADEDADAEPTPTRKAKTSKSTHARSHRTHAKAKETPETIPAPTEYTPEGIPKTSAASVIVVDANTGKILYEKNADQLDRKSTRLNSSHEWISYAVFCL